MELIMAVLCNERDRLLKKLQSPERTGVSERGDAERQLEIVNRDIERLEMYIDRSGMQTWSELLFVDDIRERARKIQARTEG